MSNYGAIIAGTGSFLPEKRLTNDELSKMVDTNDEWIVQRTGIRERRIAGPGETTATLATGAARKALEAAGLQASRPRSDHLRHHFGRDGFPLHRLLCGRCAGPAFHSRF